MINGEVYLFDSLFNGTLTPSAELQIAQLYKPLIMSNGLLVSVVPIQQQQETNNCGLFSIAAAYHTAVRSDIGLLTFNESRLRVRRARDRARRAAQTAEERDARLRQIRDNRRQSLATESEEERAVRLQQMRDRLASETEEERAARLQRMSANQRHRLAHLNCQTPAFASLPSLIHFFTHHIPRGLGRTSHAAPAAPHQPHRTTRSARACASIAFELTLAPTMLCIHLVKVL